METNATQTTQIILSVLDENKAEEIVSINLAGKTDFADYMIVASVLSRRQALSLANKVMDKFKEHGAVPVHAEGMETADWVLIDAGDVIVHLFLPEIRQLYRLEELWTNKPSSRL